jgi:hypothetical protein
LATSRLWGTKAGGVTRLATVMKRHGLTSPMVAIFPPPSPSSESYPSTTLPGHPPFRLVSSLNPNLDSIQSTLTSFISFQPTELTTNMPPLRLSPSLLFGATLLLLILYARPTHAFGAGNIASLSKIEGQNWRHGDIEDTLLNLFMSRSSGKKFSKMDVKRVYFGNWLRDYSQALDVGGLKMVSAEAIRILLWILGFMSFGYGTREFEVTRERLGVYR